MAMFMIAKDIYDNTVADNTSMHPCALPQQLYGLLLHGYISSDEKWPGDQMFSIHREIIEEEVDYIYSQFMYYQKGYVGNIINRAFHYVIELNAVECKKLGIDINSGTFESDQCKLRFFLCSTFLPLHQKMIYIRKVNTTDCRIDIIVNPVDIYNNIPHTEEEGYVILKDSMKWLQV